MRWFTETIWLNLLKAVPTYLLQHALAGRPGVSAKFIASGQSQTLTVTGVCWVTVNED